MSSTFRKKYDREYKLEVLELLRTSGKSKAQLERDPGLYQGQLRAWQQALSQDAEQAFPRHRPPNRKRRRTAPAATRE